MRSGLRISPPLRDRTLDGLRPIGNRLCELQRETSQTAPFPSRIFTISAMLAATAALIAGCGNASTTTPESDTATAPAQPSVPKRKTHKQPPIPVDATALYNSLAIIAARQYSHLRHDDYKSKQHGAGSSCEAKDRHFQCGVEIDFGILGISELWGYTVSVHQNGCWRATTLEQWGPYQDDVEAWQNRKLLAPTTRDVKEHLRVARGMRHLQGCIRSGGGDLAGSDHDATFIAGLASQDVQRAYPGSQRKTRCRSLGKETVALAPDSWNYLCRTFLHNGKSYEDKILCFDPPPYKSYDACQPQDGYPRRPPRQLPTP